MSNFYRQLWKQKPQAWGPVEAVQAALRERFEQLGINWGDLSLALPLWAPGPPVDYSSKNIVFTGQATFKDNKLSFSANKIVSSTLPANQTAVTLLTWATVSSFTSYGKIFSKGFASDGNWPSPWLCYGISLAASANALSFQVSPSPTTLDIRNVSNAYVYNAPFFAALSYDGGDFHCIVNDELKININVPGSLTTTTGPYLFGANGKSTEYHYGTQDQHLIFNTVLSDDQIFEFYDNPYQLWQPKSRTIYSIPKSAQLFINRNASWKIIDEKSTDSAWKILNEHDQSIAWKIIAEVTKDSSWKIIAETNKDVGWSVLTEKGLSASWKILNTTGQDASWKIKTQLSQDAAWEILSKFILARGVSWKILTEKDAIMAWEIKTEVSKDTAWKIFNEISQDASWTIFKINNHDAAWEIFNELQQDVSWVIGDNPGPLYIFSQEKRIFIFYQKER